MADQIPQDLRRALTARERGQGRKLPSAVRAQAAAWADHRRAAGASLSEVAEELGVVSETVRRWTGKLAQETAETALVPVEIVSDEPTHNARSRSLTVIAPGGYRVEGLTVEEAATLLRVLR
jgi:transposase